MLTNLAQCYKALEQYRKCLEYSEKAAEKDPKNVKAYFLQGVALMMLSHHETEWRPMVKKGIGNFRTGKL